MSVRHTPEKADALRMLRRWRRREERAEGPYGAGWHSVAAIRRAIMPGGGVRSDNDVVRGLLIKLIPVGDVEACEFANGVFWRSAQPLYLPAIAKAEGRS